MNLIVVSEKIIINKPKKNVKNFIFLYFKLSLNLILEKRGEYKQWNIKRNNYSFV